MSWKFNNIEYIEQRTSGFYKVKVHIVNDDEAIDQCVFFKYADEPTNEKIEQDAVALCEQLNYQPIEEPRA